ncbi:MAG: hypothetical protein HWE10_11250 [Gammaproteobacteria bacterium]|nr:hypothetical protein [Gammaproteobacteria bacterium]
MKLPIFTLPIFLLPQGITRIRVYEPRYLKLVRIASQNDGFVIYHGNKTVDNVGSWVNIVNFEQGDDDVLIIDVECRSLVGLSEFEADEEQLSFATINKITHWFDGKTQQQKVNDEIERELSVALRAVFDEHSVLQNLYETKFLDSPYWTVARWIEILPVSYADKRSFIASDSYEQAKSFVYSVVVDKN